MSDAYAVRLVDDGGTTYERFAMAVVAGAFLAFVLGAATLFGWVPVEGVVAGVSAPYYFGAGVLALGIASGALGVFSRWGAVRTTPDSTPGLGVGFSQLVIWTVTAGLVASNTVGLGWLGWLVALPIGVGAGYLTLIAREDVGGTLPAAVFIGLVGLFVLTGVIAPEWTWEPNAFDATIPGTLVIPILTMVSSLLAGWAGASAYDGFGMQGRQNGAFMLISLVVMLVLSVLVYLLVFVFQRGIMVVLENLTVGAGTALLLVLSSLVLLVRHGHVNPGVTRGAGRVLAFVHLTVASLLALGAVGFSYIIATNQSVTRNAVTIAPTTTVGALIGLFVGALFLLLARRSTPTWAPESDRGRTAELIRRVGLGILAATALIEVFSSGELAVGGIAVVRSLVFLVGGVAVGLLVVHGLDRRSSASLTRPWLPPLSHSVTMGLSAFVVACLHVTITGYPLELGPVGLTAGGTIDWPFVMNASQGLGIQIGVMPAMFGTIWLVIGAVLFAVPLAVGAAVYLTEYAEDSMFTQAVDIATNGLWSTPSIVFGLFGLAFLVPRFGGSPSIFAAQLVLGFMLLPLVLITSREAMKSVPDEYRDASAALGVSKWETIRSVVIPAAIPGITTGVILGVGRIAGETAPLLLVLNGPNFPNAGPGVLSSFAFDLSAQAPFVHVSNPALLERASALPYQLYAVITAGVGAEESFGWGTTLVLIGVVLMFFGMGIATRRYFRKKLHQ
ncbi:phosphate ABC transporter permease PstA [Halovenus marina]|uniref:phosphate ABC transporter permease PstA n=1 Tax=Halovenus marina TaxID=3396621 RepID=UPI003F54518E